MKTKQNVEELERIITQLNGLYEEIGQLARKVPNDGVNLFKLNLINAALTGANNILSGSYKPFLGFEQFDQDQLPTNSDVALILKQYMEQTERYRSNHVTYQNGHHVYVLNGRPSDIKASSRTSVGGQKK